MIHVGYGSRETGEKMAPIVGAIFAPVSGGETYDLSMLVIPGTRDEDGVAEDYCDPGMEFIRVLDPDSSATLAQYTYVSKEFIEDNLDPDEDTETWDKYYWAVGWWKFEFLYDYATAIDENDPDDMKVADAVPVTNGQAFLGFFSSAHSLRVQSNGQVNTEASAFKTAEAMAPFFVNYLPLDIKLSDITIPGTRDEDGISEDYCDPGMEFIRVLDQDSSATTAQYTYVSKEFIEDNLDPDEDTETWDKYYWAVGWWKFEFLYDYAAAIDENDPDEMKLAEDPDVVAGDGFLSFFSSAHSLDIAFPGALEVPSKQK